MSNDEKDANSHYNSGKGQNGGSQSFRRDDVLSGGVVSSSASGEFARLNGNAGGAAGSSIFDLERKTAEYLDKVRAEAARIVEEARREVKELQDQADATLRREQAALSDRAKALDEARKQLKADADAVESRWNALEQENFDDAKARGLEQGLELGKAEGARIASAEERAVAESRVSEEVERRLKETQDEATLPIKKLARELKGARQALLKNWEENIMQIAAAIAYQTIMREPALLREVPLDLLREALDLAMNCATLKIRMNPRDVANLQGAITTILEETGNLAKSEVVSDAKISIGGCVVETSLGVVDERLEARLERIVAELSE